MLTLDPAAAPLRAEPGFAVLADTWVQAAGLDRTPAAARAWACRYMVDDLGRRYSPADLAPVRAAYDRLRQRTAST